MRACILLWYDSIYYSDTGDRQVFERNAADTDLAPALIQSIQKHHIQEIVVMTWPWWFTNLRVWSLVCNLLAQYIPDISFRVVSKLDCYIWAHKQGYLSDRALIYIGQKKTVWDYDFIQQSYTLQPKENLTDSTGYAIDKVDDYFPADYEKSFVRFVREDQKLSLVYQDTSYTMESLIVAQKPLQVVQPSYYVNPIIS